MVSSRLLRQFARVRHRHSRVHRPFPARANDEQEEKSELHAKIRARFVERTEQADSLPQFNHCPPPTI